MHDLIEILFSDNSLLNDALQEFEEPLLEKLKLVEENLVVFNHVFFEIPPHKSLKLQDLE